MAWTSIFSAFRTTVFKFKTTGAVCCGLLKARSCLLNALARSEARNISGDGTCLALDLRKLLEQEHPVPMMVVRMLLKSWAIPPAIWPSASIFWACNN